jgi:hypothetical protein
MEPARLRHRSNDETALTEGRGHAVGLYSRFKWRWRLATLPFDQQRNSTRVAARLCSLLRRRQPVFPSNPAPQYPATALAKLADRDPADGLVLYVASVVPLLFSFVKSFWSQKAGPRNEKPPRGVRVSEEVFLRAEAEAAPARAAPRGRPRERHRLWTGFWGR